MWLAGNRGFDTLHDCAGQCQWELWLAGNRGFDTLRGKYERSSARLWLAGNRGFDTLGVGACDAGIGYGLPGTAASIHSKRSCTSRTGSYGLPGTAASIHSALPLAQRLLAMACREPRLRYTLGPSALDDIQLWLAGNRGFDTLVVKRKLQLF